jgi:hypothetical protein
MLHAYPSSSSSFTSATMIYDARKAKIEGDRRRLRQSRRGRLLVSTATGEDDDENDFEEDDDVMNEDEIEVNLDAALANLARERRGQMLFQTFIEENEMNEEDASEYDLFHGACLIAMHCNPELDVSEQKNRVKELAKEV